jgi:hypothetical protein
MPQPASHKPMATRTAQKNSIVIFLTVFLENKPVRRSRFLGREQPEKNIHVAYRPFPSLPAQMTF